jgi:hypothetical protein
MVDDKTSITGTIYGVDSEGPFRQKRGKERHRISGLVFASYSVLGKHYSENKPITPERFMEIMEAIPEDQRFNGTPEYACYIPQGKSVLRFSKIDPGNGSVIDEVLLQRAEDVPDEEPANTDPYKEPVSLE